MSPFRILALQQSSGSRGVVRREVTPVTARRNMQFNATLRLRRYFDFAVHLSVFPGWRTVHDSGCGECAGAACLTDDGVSVADHRLPAVRKPVSYATISASVAGPHRLVAHGRQRGSGGSETATPHSSLLGLRAPARGFGAAQDGWVGDESAMVGASGPQIRPLRGFALMV